MAWPGAHVLHWANSRVEVWRMMRVRAFFSPSERKRERNRSFVSGLGLTGDEKALDFGCGTGTTSEHLASVLAEGGRLTCVDISRRRIRIARRRLNRYANVDVHLGHLPTLPIPDGQFDFVLVAAVLHEVKKGVRWEIAASLAAKLRPGGRLVITEPTGKHHGIPAQEIRELLENAGLEERDPQLSETRYRATYTRPAQEV